MKKLLIACLTISLVLVSCKEDVKEEIIATENSKFTAMLESYGEGKLKLNPIEATFIGDSRFDAAFPDFLSDAYQEDYHSFTPLTPHN